MKKLKLLLFLLPFLGISLLTIAQSVPITGKVIDASGNAISGVNITIQGKTTGTVTNADGFFSISAPQDATLIVSSIGYTEQSIALNGKNNLTITMVQKESELGEVVVTALGITRSQKSLVYANQVVGGDELNTVKSHNLMNALNGKVAGVTISPNSSGVGGSTKVILRGNKNAFGANQPLYVIDGMPISNLGNANGQPNSTFSGGAEGGDGISNLNPDDVESITVLEGASASALYGSQAANGVIMITTKKGKAGKGTVNFSSSYTNDKVAYKPEFQNNYGATPNGNQSWGPKLSSPAKDDRLSAFYVNGHNFTNAVNFSAGSDRAQTYFSYANTSANGVMPTNSLNRHNLTFRETGRFLDDKLTLDVNVNYINQKVHNTPPHGLWLNPVIGLYVFPVGTDITHYKDNYAVPDPARNGLLTQNWVVNEDVQSNPWWIMYKDPNFSTRHRMIINASAKYEFNNWLNLQARGNMDRASDTWEQDLYAGTNPVNSPGSNGSFKRSDQTFTQTYGDVMLNFKTPAKAGFRVDGLLGASITDQNTVGTNYGAGNGLSIPNIFILQNVIASANSPVSTMAPNHNQIQSVFGNANFSYKEWIFLDITGRNDWSSNLSFTSNKSYFYSSAGLSVILNQVIKLPDFMTYAKVRGSYAEVATTVPPYITHPINSLAGGGAVNFNNVEPNPELKPTNTNSIEAGADLRFIDNRLSLNFTWYKSNTHNQFIRYTPAPSTGYSVGYLNAGNIKNTGVEVVLSYDVLKGRDFTWTSGLNYSTNKNTILALDPSSPNSPIFLTNAGANAYASVLKVGGSFADIYGVKFKRNEKGQIMLTSADQPINENLFQKIGNPNPKWQMGWNNTFNYKRLNFSFLIDGKFGGEVMSMTQMLMDSYGTSKASGDARDQGGVKVNGVSPDGNAVTSVDPWKWYSTIGGRTGIAEAYIYSATVVRLRQMSIGYDFNVGNSFIKGLRLSLIGGNLIYFYKKAPYDPEIAMSTGNGMSGLDLFGQPATRNIGAQLNISF